MPWLIVIDLDVIKQIYVKDFDNFMERPVSKFMSIIVQACHDHLFFHMQYFPDLVREASAHPGLLNARGEEWRTARNTLSPSFSTAKIKAVSSAW